MEVSKRTASATVFCGLLGLSSLLGGCSPAIQATPAPATPANVSPASGQSDPHSPATMPGNCVKLDGVVGVSTQWGSGWLDLNSRPSFAPGTQLRIGIGGNARRVLIRMLQEGESPDVLVGELGEYDVPAERAVVATTKKLFEQVKQISVHGDTPWNRFLAEGNGPATLLFVEQCR